MASALARRISPLSRSCCSDIHGTKTIEVSKNEDIFSATTVIDVWPIECQHFYLDLLVEEYSKYASLRRRCKLPG